MSDRDFIDEVARELAVHQDAVATHLGALADEAWGDLLAPTKVEELVTGGHFIDNAAELEWSAKEVAGHLRDSARVFTQRIAMLRTAHRDSDVPTLPDFDTTAEERISEYRELPTAQLLEQLDLAQGELRTAVASVHEGELEHEGVHERYGPIKLGDLLAFLPEHQREHAAQLAAMAGNEQVA